MTGLKINPFTGPDGGPVIKQKTVGYGQATNYVFDVGLKKLVQKFDGFTFDSWYNKNPWKGNKKVIISMLSGSVENQQSRRQNIIIKTIPNQYNEEDIDSFDMWAP